MPARSSPATEELAVSRRDPVRRLAILRAAATAFAHAGYAATSMEEIAAGAGVTKLIVYRHFGSKEALYRAVLEQVFVRQAELFLANIADGLQAEGTTRALVDVGREWPDGFRLVWRHAAREPQFAAEAQQLRDAAVNAARDVVNQFIAAPFQEWAAQTLFDHIVDAVLNWLDHGDPEHDDEFVRYEADGVRATIVAWTNLR
jgi:AcrR family transcriptional regulator